jgi:DNA (cytosine-5)-methyltransferase 1
MSNVTYVTSLLSRQYKDPSLNNHRDPLDEIVFILLSEKTDEAKYTTAFRNLKARFPRWTGVLSAPVREIKTAIETAGMGNRRANLLRRLFKAIVERFGALDLSMLAGMSLEEAEAELIQLPGIGRKAARCVLLYCFDFPALPVDVHTYRLAIRLGILSRRVSYEQSHEALPRLVPSHLRRRFHVNAVAHGRARCFARKPDCNGCPLAEHCSYPEAVRPLRIVARPEPLAIDLFAGGGGLSLGFEKAGFRIVQSVESNSRAAATYAHNNPDVDLIERDIRQINPRTCLARLGLRPGDLTALIGGIPCQGFSESNRRTRNSANPNNHLYKRFIRFLDVLRPAWFVIENVAGLRTMERGLILQRIIRECKALGYEVNWRELNAADFGVPQVRRRIFIIGNRFGLPIPFPEATHGPGCQLRVTVRKALGDLPVLKNGASKDYRPYGKTGRGLTKYQRMMRASRNGTGEVQGNLVTRSTDVIIKRYRHIRAGGNWEDIPTELMINYEDPSRCHTGIYHRLEWDKPAKVIGNFRKNMLIHPQQHRGLSVREAARLQSFPDDYEFLDSIGFQQQQVADAVPPLLAEAVAKHIIRADRTMGPKR